MSGDSKGSFAVIRYNLRTYGTGGVMAVIRGRETAESILKQFEQSQSSDDRHIGWRYFLEKTDLRPGMDPAEATNLRQTRLEIRESQASLNRAQENFLICVSRRNLPPGDPDPGSVSVSVHYPRPS